MIYTVAHEYSFGANHDGPTNGCEPLSGGEQHVMSPQLSSDAGPIVWSNCSRKDITRFLDRNWGSCLEDRPSDHEFHYPELPPGAMYNVDHQCRLQYGPEAMHCSGMDEVRFRFQPEMTSNYYALLMSRKMKNIMYSS